MAFPFSGNLYITNAAGQPVTGAQVLTYEAGTLTPKAAYTTPALDVAHPTTINTTNGRATLYLGSGAYRIRVVDSGGTLVPGMDWDNVISPEAKAGSVSYTASGGVETNLGTRAALLPYVTDYGAVADGTTDNTTAVLNTPGPVAFIPYNVKYNKKTLLTSLSPSKVFFDLSSINDFAATGETSKTFGIVSADNAPSDTHWAVTSGHHSIFTLNNFGTSGTTSATERKASLLWAAGQYQLGATDKRGFRSAAILQFTKEAASNNWALNLRSLAPWLSIAGEYEEWAQGQTISGAGVYRTWNAQHYVSTGAGTTGATPPTHTTGTVSDGAVSWTWLDSGDRSVFLLRQDGRWVIGEGNFTETWRHKVGLTDSTGHFIGEMVSRGASKYARLKLVPTNASNVETSVPFLQAEHDVGLRVMDSTGGTDVLRFTDNGVQHKLLGTTAAAPTIASATTIAPTTPIAFVSGTTTVATITPPAVIASTGGQITLIPTGAFATNTAGNIAIASTAVVSRALVMTWDSGTSKWYPSY